MRKLSLIGLVLLLSCGSDTVSSDEEARLAYLGLDRAIERALNLGMDGFSAAQSANIPAQTGNGDVSGTLVVSGQVDQGESPNKEMRLESAFTMYQDRFPAAADGGVDVASGITYDTVEGALPSLDLSLRGIPDGTFTGTFTGRVRMSGELRGDVTLDLAFTGDLRMPAGGAGIERVPGSTRVTGTATSEYGVYTVDLTR
jgi:hypothetical protein